MYSWQLAVVALAVLTGQQVSCKVFDRCGLVEELQKHNLGRQHVLQNWLCLIENESGRDTTKVTTRANATEYGLFQIESPQWCTPKVKGGRCNVKCEDLINDSLNDDVACAKKVYDSRNSFSPWEGWKTGCRGKPLINVSSCPTVAAAGA